MTSLRVEGVGSDDDAEAVCGAMTAVAGITFASFYPHEALEDVVASVGAPKLDIDVLGGPGPAAEALTRSAVSWTDWVDTGATVVQFNTFRLARFPRLTARPEATVLLCLARRGAAGTDHTSSCLLDEFALLVLAVDPGADSDPARLGAT